MFIIGAGGDRLCKHGSDGADGFLPHSGWCYQNSRRW